MFGCVDDRDWIVRLLVNRAAHASEKAVVGVAVRTGVEMLERPLRRLVELF